MADATADWTPRWKVPPGEVLAELLEKRGMTQAELARRMARPLKTISEISTGKAAITPDTAIQLERALGVSATVWLGLEGHFREAIARDRDHEGLRRHEKWLKRFPVRDLVREGLISDADPARQADELLSFFGVSSPTGWQQHWGSIAARYRMGNAGRVSPEAVSAWLRWGERDVEREPLPSYDPERLRAVLPELRALSTAHVFAAAFAGAVELLASAGVALVLLPSIKGAPASGATMWVKDTPLINLTLRHHRDDQFWFSLLHEIGHLLLGGRRPTVAEAVGSDGAVGPEEEAADTFARDFLMDPLAYQTFVASGDFSRTAVRRFAADLGIAPGIVVGRLQREGVIAWSSHNDLKRPIG